MHSATSLRRSVLALALIAAPLVAQTKYAITNLGTIGGTSSAGNSINHIRWVTGASTVDSSDSTIHAALWAYGLTFDLKTLGGPNSAVLWPNHNDHGILAGVSETADIDPLGEAWSCSAFFPGTATGHVCRGFVWRDGHMQELRTFGGVNGFAAADNNRGQIVGWAETQVHDGTCSGTQVLQFIAAEWDAYSGRIRQLPPYGNDPDSAATAINDSGQAVGISGLCDHAVGASSARHMVIWNRGFPTKMPTLGGDNWNTPMAINNLGNVVGFSDLPGDSPDNFNFHGFFWRQGAQELVEIKPFDGDSLVEALGVNNHNQVVGESCTAGLAACRGFIWIDGKKTDLNKLVPSGSPYILYANDINDQGEIAGGMYDPNTKIVSAFLAKPVHDDGARSDHATSVESLELQTDPQKRTLPSSVREILARRSGVKQNP